MKLRVTLAVLSAVALALVSASASAQAAPALQLPWPAGQQHRINGGNTYGCDTHNTATASSATAYNADYYAIDFQFTLDQQVSAVAAGTVIFADFTGDGYGNKVIVDHGGGYTSTYAHLNSFAVAQWSRVSQGQVLGGAGGSGGYPVHLHMHMQQNLAAYRPEPLSNIPGPVFSQSFSYYGFSVENSGQCASHPNDPSPYWASRAPYVGIEGTLVQGSTASVYVIDQGAKRPITSIGMFTSCGYQSADISKLDQATVNAIPTGTAVSLPCPGTLAKTSGASTVWVISGGWKRALAGAGLLAWCYPDASVVTVTTSQINSVPTGNQLYGPPCPYVRHLWYDRALLNGTLVKGSDFAVYVLEGGTRRPIPSSALFESCGYLWPTIVTISNQARDAIPLGTPLGGRPCPHTLDVATVTVYVVENFLKRPVAGAGVIDWCGYFWTNVITVTQAELNSIGTGAPLAAPPCPYARQ